MSTIYTVLGKHKARHFANDKALMRKGVLLIASSKEAVNDYLEQANDILAQVEVWFGPLHNEPLGKIGQFIQIYYKVKLKKKNGKFILE